VIRCELIFSRFAISLYNYNGVALLLSKETFPIPTAIGGVGLALLSLLSLVALTVAATAPVFHTRIAANLISSSHHFEFSLNGCIELTIGKVSSGI
jgi:hypothetical protein